MMFTCLKKYSFLDSITRAREKLREVEVTSASDLQTEVETSPQKRKKR